MNQVCGNGSKVVMVQSMIQWWYLQATLKPGLSPYGRTATILTMTESSVINSGKGYVYVSQLFSRAKFTLHGNKYFFEVTGLAV